MKDFYTAPEAAAEILQERKQNPVLKERVLDYLGGLLPSQCLLEEYPVATLARYVPRATEEDKLYADFSREFGFIPQWASYVGDRFTTRNPEKVDTIRPPITWQKGQRTRSWVVDPEKRQGGVGELETIYGSSSVAFQTEMRRIVFANNGNLDLLKNTFDMGQWYRVQAQRFGYTDGNLAPYYYVASMALNTMFCALFENFDSGPNAGNGDLARFCNSVVYPAFERVREDLGIQPVIVKLPYQPGANVTNLSFLDTESVTSFRSYGRLMTSLSGTV